MSFHYIDPSLTKEPVAQADPESIFLLTPSLEGQSFYRRRGKRLLDILLCLLLAPVAFPMIGLLAVLISLTGDAPFFAQNRVGKHGRIFRMWKLRSMLRNGDGVLEAYLATNETARLEWRHAQKLRFDPRVTSLGAFLRRTSLDELPQIWNVLRGEMSLVGPRPMLISQQPLYPGRDYYAMLPGISGNWQVSTRNESRFSDRAVFDTIYFQDVSLVLDLAILKNTIWAVLRATGR